MEHNDYNELELKLEIMFVVGMLVGYMRNDMPEIPQINAFINNHGN